VEIYVNAIVVSTMLLLLVGAWRLRKRRSRPGPAAAAMMHEMLNDDRRAAVEIILEKRAEAQAPEDRDDIGPTRRP
jgi:hypothetical protein